MANQDHILASRTNPKFVQGMTTQLSKDKLCMRDSGLQESSRTDSGFLSGANLLSDQNISSDDLSTPISQKSAPELDSRMKISNSYMRMDSGVSLNNQFSGLSLHTNSDYNDLSSDGKYSGGDKTDEIERPTEPWELYFQQDEDGDTQLHIAIIQDFIEVALSLIRLAPHPSLLDLRNKVAQAPLHLAVLTHQTRLVRRLVISGADVARVDRNGNTALHLACGAGYMDCVRALTMPITVNEMSAAGVRCLTQQLPRALDESNYDGEMCIHLAAKGSHIDVLRHLACLRVDINAREYKSGKTILHYAVENLDEKLLNFLLERTCADLNLDMPTYAGHSAYQLAAAIKFTAASSALLARGASAMDMSDDEEHPDHNAEDSSDDEEMSSLDDVRSGLEGYARNQVPVL